MARTQGLSQNEQIVFVSKCVHSLEFKMAAFSKFDALNKSSVLRRLLTEAKSYNQGQNYQNVIRKLINAFGIKYSPDTGKLGMKLSNPDEKGVAIFMNLCFEQIKQADSIIIETFDKLLVSASLKDYIKKYKIPGIKTNFAVPQRKDALFSTIDILNAQIKYNVSSKEINYPILIKATAGYSLVAYYLGENIQNLTLQEIIDDNTNHSLLCMAPILVNPKNYREFNLKVTKEALQILEDFKKTNLPNQYWQDKDRFILKLVE